MIDISQYDAPIGRKHVIYYDSTAPGKALHFIQIFWNILLSMKSYLLIATLTLPLELIPCKRLPTGMKPNILRNSFGDNKDDAVIFNGIFTKFWADFSIVWSIN